jgi:two-component system, NarL family, response regulator NreC
VARHLRAVDGLGTTRAIRVLLADDHPAIRRSLRALLEREADIHVVAEASELQTVAAQLRAHRPNVLVLDARMPDGSGIEHIRALRDQAPRTQIVIVTMHKNQAFADQALKAGAIGYVLKDAADSELCTAVRSAADKQPYRSSRLT